MPRKLRSYVPGGFFHITARTQGRVHWFDPPFVRSRIVAYIATAVEETDVDLLAYVVMTNHIHLVIRQHHDPLARLMQSLLRRCALLVHRVHGVAGHVFERPYWDKLCADACTLRNWIRYVHRNPVTAGLCATVDDYEWSSHTRWATESDTDTPATPRLLTPRDIFCISADRTFTTAGSDYAAFVTEERSDDQTPAAHRAHGDVVWENHYALTTYQPRIRPSTRPDLRNVVACALSQLCPDLDIEMLRTFRGARLIRIRHQLVERAALAGHSGCKIARYLHVSEATVSRIVRRLAKPDSRTPRTAE